MWLAPTIALMTASTRRLIIQAGNTTFPGGTFMWSVRMRTSVFHPKSFNWRRRSTNFCDIDLQTQQGPSLTRPAGKIILSTLFVCKIQMRSKHREIMTKDIYFTKRKMNKFICF